MVMNFTEVDNLRHGEIFKAMKPDIENGKRVWEAVDRFLAKHHTYLTPIERRGVEESVRTALEAERLSKAHYGFAKRFSRELEVLRADKGFCDFVKQGVKTALTRE